MCSAHAQHGGQPRTYAGSYMEPLSPTLSSADPFTLFSSLDPLPRLLARKMAVSLRVIAIDNVAKFHDTELALKAKWQEKRENMTPFILCTWQQPPLRFLYPSAQVSLRHIRCPSCCHGGGSTVSAASGLEAERTEK